MIRELVTVSPYKCIWEEVIKGASKITENHMKNSVQNSIDNSIWSMVGESVWDSVAQPCSQVIKKFVDEHN